MKRKDFEENQSDVVWYILVFFVCLFKKMSLVSKRKVKFAKSNEEVYHHRKSDYFKTC